MPRNNIYFVEETTGGRPKMILNEEGQRAIRSLSQYQCTYDEIAAFLEVKLDTLLNANNKEMFMECIKKGKNQGKASLRRVQWELAKKNASMAIFLGKQYLNQTETVEQEQTISDTPVAIYINGTDMSDKAREERMEKEIIDGNKDS